MVEIKWTEKASFNLHAIFEFIAKDSKTYARRYLRALILATKKLEEMPLCGRIVPEFENPELREVIYGNYRIIYRVVEKDCVEILSVVHGARDIKTLSRKEWEL